MTKLKAIILASVFFLGPACAIANNFLGKNYVTGWHFYREEYKIEESKLDPDVTRVAKQSYTMPEPEEEDDPLAWAEQARKKTEWLKARALRNPNEQNTLEYIKYQTEVTNKAEQFSNIWPHILRKYPELDFSVNNPVTQSGRHVFLDEKTKQDKQNIKHLSERFGLFFFFKADCPYCHLQGPIVSNFAKSFNIAVMAISLDGQGVVEGFNDSQIQPDNGIASSLGIDATPAIVAVDHQTQEIIPIHTGLISYNDLLQTISEVVIYENL